MTLLEVLVASSLLALVAGMLATALHLGFKSYRLHNDRMLQSREQSMFISRLDGEISISVFGSAGTPPMPAVLTTPVFATPLEMRRNTDASPVAVAYYYIPAQKAVARREAGLPAQVILRNVEEFAYKVGNNAANSVLIQCRMSSEKNPVQWESEWVDLGW